MRVITVARKPLSESTIASNVLKWGTGALNIDGSRLRLQEGEQEVLDKRSGACSQEGVVFAKVGLYEEGRRFKSHQEGRWPTNVILEATPEILGALPHTVSSARNPLTCTKKQGGSQVQSTSYEHTYEDAGSVARFFKQVHP